MDKKVIQQLTKIKIGLASPEEILSWSKRENSDGEVTKAETINYRSQRPEMDGLFCEKIFGPSKDYECHCGRYKKIKNQGHICERCGVEVTVKDVRRERMGHIKLAAKCSHIWFLKGVPSKMATLLGMSPKRLEDIIYYNAHICLDPGILPDGEKERVLAKNQYIDEKEGKEIFRKALLQVKEIVKAKGDEAILPAIEDYIKNLSDENIQSFDYYSISRIISKYLGAKFGEGAEAIEELLKNINIEEEIEKIRKKLKDKKEGNKGQIDNDIKRLAVLEAFKTSGNKPEWMILSVLPVIPPDLRPMLPLDGGRYATSDLNDLYTRVIHRNTRLKDFIEKKSPRLLITCEARMLQEAVDALIDNGRRTGKPVLGAGNKPLKSLSEILKGKQGRFRQNLLGKRVDYSGRSVIAIGPDLRIYQCGLPREMAIKLLRPYIACELMKNKTALSHSQADKMIDRGDKEVYDVLEKIIDKHPVLLNRAPTLHRLGIQAFQPKLVEGRAIRLHPLVCAGFNADFDGDQMAVHVPLSRGAQEEAVNLMLASNNILGPKDGKPIVTPSQDIVIGNYYLTTEADKKYFLDKAEKLDAMGDHEEANKFRVYAANEGKVFKDIDEALLAYSLEKIHLHNRIAIVGRALKKDEFSEEMNNSYLITTAGKLIFNLIFPSDFPYINEMTKKDSSNLKGTKLSFFVKKGENIREIIEKTPLREPFVKKSLGSLIDETFNRYGTSKTSAVIDKIKDLGFKYSTKSGVTVALSDIVSIPNKKEIIEAGDKQVERIERSYRKGLLNAKERHEAVCNVWTNISGNNGIIEAEVTKKLNEDVHNPLYIMFASGARGNIANFKQLIGMRGLMANTAGDTIEIPVKSCFLEGLNVSEFFTCTHGARKGGADTALKTADSGYLTRRLVDVAQDIVVREVDCGTDHGFIVKDIIDESENKPIVKLKDRLVGRFSLRDIVDSEGNVIVPGNTMMTEEDADRVAKAGIKEVEIRSVFGCETKDGVCIHCYGKSLATGKLVEIGQAVGIMAAQSIGEPGTQLTMRTFHTGGVAGGDITNGLPRIQELFEARTPKGEAVIAEFAGEVVEIAENKDEDNKTYKVLIRNNDILVKADDKSEAKPQEKYYSTPYGAKFRVKKGDFVNCGDKITEGAIAPRALLTAAGVAAVEEYIMNEVHKVYRGNAIDISDKHIEIIVRQMLRKVLVVENGDTNLLPNTITSINEFTKENGDALVNGRHPAKATPFILGITKAALETDSFLSAASFQETTKVLTDAAIKGKVDTLHGLKENVITGRLIPAGRGLLDQAEQDEELLNFDVLDKMKEVNDNYIEVYDTSLD